MTPIERVIDRLPGARRQGKGWVARCPAHDDRRPSLSITEGEDGRVLVHCHAGCTVESVVSALGLSMSDLMPDRADQPDRPPTTPQAPRKKTDQPCQTYATAEEALASLGRQYGKPSHVYHYHDANGDTVGLVVRWDGPAGKKILPVSKTPGGWAVCGMPEPRPLYRLPDLLTRTGERVYVVEGEKAADAARALGLLATTSTNGSKSAANADWSPLAGREVVILPDHDEPGAQYAASVASILAKLTPTPKVRIVNLVDAWPNLPAGGDIADVVRHEDVDTIKAKLAELVGRAEVMEPDTTAGPQMEPRQAFPVTALPAPVALFVVRCAEAIGCDPSFVALPLLVGFAGAIGNSRRIHIKHIWSEPAILWGAVIGESGSTKSPALELALRAVRQRQASKMQEYKAALDQWQRDLEIHEMEKAAWKRDAMRKRKGAGSTSEVPQAPQAPTCDRCWTDDVTIEALAKLLQDNPRGMLVIRDELAGWLHFDRYSANGKGKERAAWLEMHGGRPVVVDRKTSGTIDVPRAAVSIIGGIQPGILARYVGQEHRDSGLLARLLLTMPPRRRKVWTEADIDPMDEAAIADIFDRLYSLEMPSDDKGEPRPVILNMTPEGKRAWVEFFNEHNAEAVEMTGDLAAAWSKLEGYAARFALVHHLVRQASGEQVGDGVDAESIAAGVRLSRWFAREARRVYAMLAEDDEARQCRQWVELITRKGGSVTVRDWQRARSHRKAADAEAELAELVKAGVGRWEEVAPGPQGGRGVKRFVLATGTLTQPRDQPAPIGLGALESGVVSVVSVSE